MSCCIRIYRDLTKVTGRSGEKNFLTITDGFSFKAPVYPLRDRSQVFKVFTNHVKRAECFLNTKVKNVRSVNGRELSKGILRTMVSNMSSQTSLHQNKMASQNA